MSKFRSVNTKFWDDSYISELDPSEKLLYLYFITNPLTDLSGIYEIPLKRISYDTGFNSDMVKKILERFTKDGKVFYFDGWLVLKNFIRNQTLNPSILKGIERSLKNVPQSVWLKIQENAELGTAWVQTVGTLVHLNLNLNLNLNSNLNSNAEATVPDEDNLDETSTDEPIDQPEEDSRTRSEPEPPQSLADLVKPYEEKYGEEMIKAFLLHWTQKNDNGKKELWQMQKVFDVPKRLATWAGKPWNQSKQSKAGSGGQFGEITLHDNTKAIWRGGRWVDARDTNVSIDPAYYPELNKH